MIIKHGYTSGCRRARRGFRSVPLREGWGSHAGAAALTAGPRAAETANYSLIHLIFFLSFFFLMLWFNRLCSQKVIIREAWSGAPSGQPWYCLSGCGHLLTHVPQLTEILALLFDSALDPGCDIIAQLGEGVILRRGQAAFILRRLRAGEGLEAAALGATHCCVRWCVPL